MGKKLCLCLFLGVATQISLLRDLVVLHSSKIIGIDMTYYFSKKNKTFYYYLIQANEIMMGSICCPNFLNFPMYNIMRYVGYVSINILLSIS